MSNLVRIWVVHLYGFCIANRVKNDFFSNFIFLHKTENYTVLEFKNSIKNFKNLALLLWSTPIFIPSLIFLLNDDHFNSTMKMPPRRYGIYWISSIQTLYFRPTCDSHVHVTSACPCYHRCLTYQDVLLITSNWRSFF